MTKVTFSSQGGKLLSVDILGHAGYAEEGEDIVCAAVSSAVMLTTVLLDDRMRFARSNCIFPCWSKIIRIF